MKKTLLIVSVFLSLLTSCSDKQGMLSEVNNTVSEVQMKTTNSDFSSFNLPFPQGTTFEFIESELRFSLPEPYYIVGIDENGNYYQSISGGSGSVTCKCTEGAGCDPIKQGEDYGCLMRGGCSECSKSNSSISGLDVELKEILIMNDEVNLFINQFSQLENQVLLPKDFFNFDTIQTLLLNIEADLQSNFPQANSDQSKVVFVNAYGYILPILVPVESDNTSLTFISVGGGDGVTCSCDVSGDCPKETHWTGGVVWCNSENCTTCTMSGTIKDKDGTEKQFSEDGGWISIN